MNHSTAVLPTTWSDDAQQCTRSALPRRRPDCQRTRPAKPVLPQKAKILLSQRSSALSGIVAVRWMMQEANGSAAVLPPVATPPGGGVGEAVRPHPPGTCATSCFPHWVPEAPQRSSARPCEPETEQCRRASPAKSLSGNLARFSQACGLPP